jgi:DNA polymerase III delta subunit
LTVADRQGGGSLAKALAGAKAPPVVAALGPETYLQEETLRAVALAYLGAADSPDVVTIQPDASIEPVGETAARFLGEVRTSSLFGGRKVVALRDADAVAAAAKAGFVAWLAAPAPSVVAVLLGEELPADVAKAVDANGIVVRCGGRGGSGESAVNFIQRRAGDRGKRISATDADLLAERVGGELTSLDNAVEILCLHAGEQEAITAADVEALFRSAREGTIWEFGDALAEGNAAAALTEAQRCFAEGVPEDFSGERVTFDERRIATKLVSSFTTSLTRALVLRRQIDAGVPRGELQFTGPAFKGFLPWKAKERVTRTAQRRRAEALEALLLRAEETERGMKSGGADGRLAVARLATMAGLVK